MNTSYLHITSGDFATNAIQKLQLKGTIITWREMLSEGKTTSNVGSEDFWKSRFDFLKSSYKITKKTFIDYTLKEYRSLCKQKDQEGIVLWFEQNLFSQINMIAVLNWLKKHRKGRTIYLVSDKEFKNSKEQLQTSFKHKIMLTQDDIEYADYIWQLYCSDSPLRLETVFLQNSNTTFSHLEKAIKSHLSRFPSIENGLNSVENNILQTANHQTLENKEQLVENLLVNQGGFGFGHLQYNRKIDSLKELFLSFNPVKISKTGKKILENQVNYYANLRSDFSYLGGAKKYNFLYYNATEKLLKISS